MDVKTLIFVLLVPACTGAVMINQGCSAFPREIQFLCYQIGKIWGQNQISNNVVENVPSAEGEDHVALAINGVGYEHNKLQGLYSHLHTIIVYFLFVSLFDFLFIC